MYSIQDLLISSLFFGEFMCIMAILMAVVEAIRPVQKIKLIKKEFWRDLAYAFMMMVVVAPATNVFVSLLTEQALTPLFPHQMFDTTIQSLPMWFQVFLGLLILDFIVYIRHRFMHERLWLVHAIHHSPNEINWLTKYRLHPFEVVIAVLVGAVVMHFVGFSGKGIATAGTILSAMDVLNHINIRLRYPAPFCYLLSCPDYHKWHHATEQQALNKNYVVVFPFLDLLFGSYYFPDKAMPKAVGLVASPDSKNVFPDQFIKQLLYPIQAYRRVK